MSYPRSKSASRAVATDTALGAVLGAGAALATLSVNSAHVLRMILSGSEPIVTTTVFVGTFVSLFGVGAGLSGCVFLLARRR